MVERDNSNSTSPPDSEDYVAWVMRILKIALGGGPNVVSARAIAARHANCDDTDLQAEAAIREIRREMFSAPELNQVTRLLDPDGALDKGHADSLARWVVFARQATTIALIYENDPEKDWVKTAILMAMDTTPLEEYWRQARRDETETILSTLARILGNPVVRAQVVARISRLVFQGKKAGAVRMTLLLVVMFLRFAPSRIAAYRDVRRCRRIGERAQRIFRYRALPHTTESGLNA